VQQLMLATFVKKKNGIQLKIIHMQIILGITGILLINLFKNKKIKIQQQGILTQYISAY
jgi:hypothetical protein